METTSTNTVAASEARRGAEEGLVVVADYQSAGRGRFDRRWVAPAGTALLFSVLLRPALAGPGALAPERGHLVVAAVSLAVADAAQEVAGARLALKWPNDLLGPDGRKVAGVLAEVAAEPRGTGRVAKGGGAIVVGVGLNVSWAPEGATSLEALAGRAVDRDALLSAALEALARLYGHWEDVARRYRAALATLGREVVVRLAVEGHEPGGGRAGRGAGAHAAPAEAVELRGTALDVRPDGRLLLSTADGVVEVAAGDVEHASLADVGPRAGPGDPGAGPR